MLSNAIETAALNDLIIGRVEPHIYAFSTETVPNYLKIGDTYRPVSIRLGEWRNKYPNLKQVYAESARVDDDTIFRDFAIHDYLERVKHLHRLQPGEMPTIPYYSKEFFKDAKKADIEEARADILKDAHDNSGKYTFYTTDHMPKTFTYRRGKCLPPRANQEDVIANFKKARKHGRRNLLMFAVMRFGKSFTSMCCAKEMNAKLVLVVSAKADVKDEWKKTVESIGNFEGYSFADKTDLLSDGAMLRKARKDRKRIVLFLTLQDLQGNKVKEAHKEVFSVNWDLLLVDETHFGARAEHYGDVLLTKTELELQMKDVDTLDDLDNVVKELHTNTTIHLSGTPYRILMGSEFEKEDIIAFVQFSDIAAAQEEWMNAHRLRDDFAEWDNPYFGFPQMIRFAFSPNQASLDRIKQLQESGATASFSEMFRPRSLTEVSSNLHKQFVHTDVVLDLLQVIDGSKFDANVLGFLDNQLIRDGKLCRHMVFVLPYCASCDAMQSLLEANKASFRNLSEYEIVNISGLNAAKAYKDTADVKRHIAECEAAGIKTITLTVNRMLTGNTVPQWDTMLYLKQTASPEEYDQAIFRLQNPFIDEYTTPSGDVIKYNLKPQTIVVDFDPERVFRLQERKSQIYNVNTERNGNSRLKERIERELKISPIIIVDHKKLREVTAGNILDAVRNYAATRSVIDEAHELPIDGSLLINPIIQEALSHLNPIDSKSGLIQSAHKPKDEADEDSIDISVSTPDATQHNSEGPTDSSSADTETTKSDLVNRFAAYYALILFFAFLTEDEIASLDEMIRVMNSSANNRRLCENLGLQKNVLKAIQKNCNGFMLSKLDYKIQNINSLTRDCSKSPMERVATALTKFGRMSEAEVVTPIHVADDMIATLPDDLFANKARVLDIASKQGEMLTACIRRYGADAGQQVYSICTSPLAYEFTRKVYSLLSLPINHIYSTFTSFDLIDKSKNSEIVNHLKKMKFRAIVGNPPYQNMDGGGTGSSAVPIYNKFVSVAKVVNHQFITMIMPAKWYSGGRGLDDFREEMLNDKQISLLVDYSNPHECFPNVDVAGGLCYILWDKTHFGQCNVVSVNNGIRTSTERDLNEYEIFIRNTQTINIIDKVKKLSSGHFLDKKVYSSKPFGLRSFEKGFPAQPGRNIQLFGSDGISYLSESEVPQNVDLAPQWKVIMSKASAEHAGQTDKEGRKRIVSRLEVLPPGTICTESYLLLDTFDQEEPAANMAKYMRTQFVRFLISSILLTQNIVRDKFRFVPLQDFTENSDIDWSKSVSEIDQQLYEKYHLSDKEVQFIESMIKPM